MTRSSARGKLTTTAALVELRKQLLALNATGPAGFEGLVATALADLTGLTFRLAKSGSQFGRDATTPRARFSIAMEAKRYAEPLRLEDVAGKIWIASHELASDVDLWALCATSEMGDGVLAKLDEMLEHQGISLLILDWALAPLPRLAVLLAATRVAVNSWIAENGSKASRQKIDSALMAIEVDAAFGQSRDQLVVDASAEFAGLAALAQANKKWCERAFSERHASRLAFGQYLTVTEPARPAIGRATLGKSLASALASHQQTPSCVAVLGPEGAGKSWLVAHWWAEAGDKPILLIGGAQAAHLIEAKDPLQTLANLISVQRDGDLGEDARRWLRRLRRWSSQTFANCAEQPRFLVLLDGLNERSGMPWAECIVRLSAEVSKLHGRLLLTCRKGFWDREIATRLAGVTVSEIKVGEYSQEELDELLRQRGIGSDAIPEHLRAFIRNPRICSIALDLLGRLSMQADELTVERLLLEYWRWRLEERGDLIAHSLPDFDKLLRSHAKEFRSEPGIQYDRDDWRTHSGAARRGDGRSIENDLSDIEEGAFLQVVADRPGYYAFKPEVVPFALGLLVARELQDELRKPDRSPAEVIAAIVEEVQSFDLVGDALRAAAGIACFEANYPSEGRAALISGWLDLQNIPEAGYAALIAYVTASPAAVLDATELAFDGRSHPPRRRDWLLDAIFETRDRLSVESVLTPRIGRWLGRWSRTPRQLGLRDESEQNRIREQTARIAARYDQLTVAERDFFLKSCVEVERPEAMQLDAAAALLMSGRPQAAQATGLLAWAFSSSLTGDFRRAEEDLCWSVRLNLIDLPALQESLRLEMAAIGSFSETGRQAVAKALRLLGTSAASADANELCPLQPGMRWRRVENYCATDPFDPKSERPPNLGAALDEARRIEPDKVWSQFSQNEFDLKLGWITAALARFEIAEIKQLLRTVIRSAEMRDQLSLRQISWRLPELSPLYDARTSATVLFCYERLIQQPNLLADDDQEHVAGSVLLSLLPHYPSAIQLRLFLQLPERVGLWDRFRDVFTPLDATEFEAALLAAVDDRVSLMRTMFFASAKSTTLTANVRNLLGQALQHSDPVVVACASEVALAANDREMDRLLIAANRHRLKQDDVAPERTFHRDRAIAAAVIALRQHEDSDLIALPFLGLAATQLGSPFDRRAVAAIDLVVDRMMRPIRTMEPKLGRLFREVGQGDRTSSWRVDDRADDDQEQSMEALRQSMAKGDDPRRDIEEHSARQQALLNELHAYLDSLRLEGVDALALEPDITALEWVVAWRPDKAIQWANRVIAESDRRLLSNSRNFALGLVEALASYRPALAAALLNHVAGVRSPVTILAGPGRVPQEIVALFAGCDSAEMFALRERYLCSAKTDADLEMLVLAAESKGFSQWLERWIAVEAASEFPGRAARALMVEGLRNAETESMLLLQDWGSGFLGEVAKNARFVHDRNRWARNWSARAVGASDPVDFWRYGILTAGIADIRACHWFDPNLDAPLVQRFGSELFARIRTASIKRTKKRRDTLFGLKRPDSRFLC